MRRCFQLPKFKKACTLVDYEISLFEHDSRFFCSVIRFGKKTRPFVEQDGIPSSLNRRVVFLPNKTSVEMFDKKTRLYVELEKTSSC